jgi:serine protease
VDLKRFYLAPVWLLIIALVVITAGIGMPVSAEEAHGTHGTEAPVVDGKSKPVTGPPQAESFDAPHMILTKEEREEMQREIDAAPKYSATASIPRGSVSLLPYLPYNATERNQGHAGDCWVWGSTGALEIEHAVKYAIFDRLSIQYFVDNSGMGPVGVYSACHGGNPTRFAAWYTNTSDNPGMRVIPWSNENAFYNPHCSLPFTPAPAVSISPAYQLKSISVSTISTQGVPQATAINNIKSALSNNHPVIIGYHYAPATANAFHKFWGSQPETSIWDPSRYNGDSGAGGHIMLIVGYDDKTDPNNPYWLVVNSWGAPGNRPDGTFRLAMNMNYSAMVYPPEEKARSMPQHFFQILDVTFADTPSVPVVSGVSPVSGPVGTRVSITGIGFTKATAVTFGGTPASSFTVTSDSTMTAIAPFQRGNAEVIVTTPAGISAASAVSVYTFDGAPATGVTKSPLSLFTTIAGLGAVCLLSMARRIK